ncbi:uncharacterized mitochondrial protein AtMg00810-like [Benincasa hispida]|uniref:uncharacterized mitochondrial protein AtMg00810-like n=1 Tax=Benincasa hispida TaxID=102211 RepID=UPI0019008A73|nr:uncharacterized mitochondrial protein AtMg00810-like [Benincasa hispida]
MSVPSNTPLSSSPNDDNPLPESSSLPPAQNSSPHSQQSPSFVPNENERSFTHVPLSSSSLVVNQHPMVTRGKNRILKPKIFVVEYVEEEPLNVKEALKCSHWVQAMTEEFKALIANDTWSLESQPSNKKVSYPEWWFVSVTKEIYIRSVIQSKDARCKVLATPIVNGSVLSAFHGERFDDVRLYKSIVGALQYVTLTRPKISYSVNKVCQFMHSPNCLHWQAVKRILKYLTGTIDHELLFKKPKDLTILGFDDADCASNSDDRKSTFGVCVSFGGNLIQWASKKQTIISRSSTKTQYRSLALASSELVWLYSLFTDLHI